MKRIIVGSLVWLGLVASALAQTFSMPPPAGVAVIGCVYNLSPPTLLTATAGYLQCDSTGKLITSGGGGGGGGAVTVADGADVTQGSLADAAWVSGSGSVVAILKNIAGGVAGSVPAGSAVIGKVGIDQTTPGTTNLVQTTTQGPVAPATATATKTDVIGCQYNSTNLAFTNGQQGQVGCDQRGGLYVQDGQAIASVSVTSAATLFTIADTSGYGSVSVQVTSAGSASTITYEASEDGTTWTAVYGYIPNSTPTSSGSTTSSSVVLTWFPLTSKQFRARVSTYGSGTITVQGTLRKDSLPRQTMNVGVFGGVSVYGQNNDATAVGSSVNIGVVSEARTTNKTAVSNATYVRPIATTVGVTIEKPYQIPELDWSYASASGGISNTATAVTMVAAAGSGIRNYVTSCQISSDALGAATELAIRDGAAGTVIWRGKLQTAALGPTALNIPSPIKSTANTLLEVVTLTATITGGVYVNCQGYQAP